MGLSQEGELNLRDAYMLLRKRRSVVILVAAGFLILGVLYCVFSTRRYEATGVLQIEKKSDASLGLESLLGDSDSSDNPLSSNIDLATQADILSSDTICLKVIGNLHLDRTADFNSGLLLGRNTATLDQSPERVRQVLHVFHKNLVVKPISGTKLISVAYRNPDPKLAAAVVNELMRALSDFSFQTRFNATTQTSTWLTGQLAELRKQSEDLQKQVTSLESDAGLYSLGAGSDQSQSVGYSTVLEQLKSSSMALLVAQQNTVLRGSIARAAQSGDVESLSGLAGSTAQSASGAASFPLLVSLRQQEAQQVSGLKEAEAKYGSAYPKLKEMRESLEGTHGLIAKELERIKKRAVSDYEIAKQTEASLRAQYNVDKNAADKANKKAVEFMITRQEAEESRTLYEDLLKKLKSAGVLEGLKSTNISVIDPGREPSKPVRPNIPIAILASLGLGVIAGIVAAMLLEALDSRISGTQMLEEITGQSLYGALPQVEPNRGTGKQQGTKSLVALDEPFSTFSEAVRSLRTAVMLTSSMQRCRVILITSSIPGEGKTYISSNLAVVLAQLNRKVLLVDVDMRRGRLSSLFNIPQHSGLSEFLAGQVSEPHVITHSEVPTLDILTSGARPPNPADLLNTKIFDAISAWRESYDFVVLDGPPMLPVTDAQIIHPYVDITLLVARSGITERSQVQRCYRALSKPSLNFVGVALNGLRPQDESYYGYYGYRTYSYRYAEDENENS